MLNPNDIANKKFDKSMGRGYKADEVEKYLNQLSNEIRDIIAEKSDLEQKLLVLAEKLEEYKQDEESMRSALVGAQKLGDSVVRDAKAKAAAIVDEANAKANRIIENSKHAVEREKSGFLRMQREVATFKSKLQLMYKQHLELISSIPWDEHIANAVPTPPLQKKEPDPESEFVDPADIPLPQNDHFQEPVSVEDSLQYTEEDGILYTDEKNMETMRSSSSNSLHRESRFGPLKFGKEYDIKREEKRKR